MATSLINPSSERARRTIEALRFGLVPNEALADLTVDYPLWRRWIHGRLPGQNGHASTVSEVVGHFGTGKSHSMALVRHVAREQGYVTGRVEVDGRSITLANPETFLYSLWNSLRLPSGEPVELIDLYLAAIRRSSHPPYVVPRGKDRISRNFTVVRELNRYGRIEALRYPVNAILSSSDEFVAAEVKKMLSGEGWLSHPYSDIYRMVGKKVSERPYDFLESLIGHALIAQQAGCGGLVVTIDEFEVEGACLNHEMRSREADLLRVLKSYLQGNLSHPPSPFALFFATAAVNRGAGDAIVDELINDCDGEYRFLEAFTESHYKELASSIFKMYVCAYGCSPHLPRHCVELALESSTDRENRTREFIRRFVFLLDSSFGPPDAILR